MSDMIQWQRAKYWEKTWNPMIGCQPCSQACDNCYAAGWAKRFGQSFKPHYTRQRPPRSGVVFVGNMTDMFGGWVECEEMTENIASTLGYSHKATYLWLTKRAERMVDVLLRGQAMLKDESEPDGVDLFPFRDCEMSNQYFGITAENQERYNERLLPLYRAHEKWMQFWVSAEPLLGPLRLGLDGELIPGTYKWLVVGCESGPRRRPCKLEWVESIVDQCRSRGVPVFVKQLDINGKCERDITKFPAHLRIRQVPWATEKGGAE